MLVAALAGCARHSTTNAPAASTGSPVAASATPAVAESVAPVVTAPVRAHATESPAATPKRAVERVGPVVVAPRPQPTARPAVSPAASRTTPQILSLATTPAVVHAGDTVRWDVRTSRDVSAVTAKVATFGFTLERVGPGHFTFAFAIPPAVPFFFHGTYRLAVLAVAPAGAARAEATINFR